MLIFACMVLADALPRWEIHGHGVAGQDRMHSALLEAHVGLVQLAHEDAGQHESGDHAIDDNEVSSGSSIDKDLDIAPHLHDVATVCASLPAFAQLDLPVILPDRWLRTLQSAAAPSVAGPPPHRPPIT